MLNVSKIPCLLAFLARPWTSFSCCFRFATSASALYLTMYVSGMIKLANTPSFLMGAAARVREETADTARLTNSASHFIETDGERKTKERRELDQKHRFYTPA